VGLLTLEKADVTKVKELEQLIQTVVNKFGGFHYVAINHGVQGEFKKIHEIDLTKDEAAKVVNVNILGALNCLTICSKWLVEKGQGGSIVLTASLAHTGAPNMAAYSASKGAVVSLTKTAAKDLAPHGIRVNCISPKFIGPDDGYMWRRQVEQQSAVGSQYFSSDPATTAAAMVASVPLRRLGSPDEVASVVAFLFSDDASYLTGNNIEITGG